MAAKEVRFGSDARESDNLDRLVWGIAQTLD